MTAWIQWDALPVLGGVVAIVVCAGLLGSLGNRASERSGERWRQKLSSHASDERRSSGPDA